MNELSDGFVVVSCVTHNVMCITSLQHYGGNVSVETAFGNSCQVTIESYIFKLFVKSSPDEEDNTDDYIIRLMILGDGDVAMISLC